MIAGKNNGYARGAKHAHELRGSVRRATMRIAMRVHHCRHREEGSTLVEMALVMPILLVVLTGVFSFGVALNQYLVLTNAVNNGARGFAMSAPSGAGPTQINTNHDPCQYAAQIVQASAGNLTSSNISYTITYTLNSSGASTTYTGTGSSLPSCSNLTMNPMDVVLVKAVYPVTPVLYGWASHALSLTAQSAELVQ